MSRKDYEMIAAVIRWRVNNPGLVDKLTLGLIAADLGMALKADNPRFDRDKFLEACGF